MESKISEGATRQAAQQGAEDASPATFFETAAKKLAAVFAPETPPLLYKRPPTVPIAGRERLN